MMNQYDLHCQRIKTDLINISTAEKAASSRRYFPAGIDCVGATAPDIKLIISNFQAEHNDITADEMLEVAECLLRNAEFNEEKLVAFGLINKFVKNNYNDELLLRFEFWLEHYANNWSLVDDLCIKTIYKFLISRSHLIENMQHWAHSNVSWCRRASCVVWVKFVKRKIGKSTYYLDKSLIFKHCSLLLNDDDEFVQKSVGWLLKSASVQYPDDVVHFIKHNGSAMNRSTIRYAIEKLDKDTRSLLLRTVKPL